MKIKLTKKDEKFTIQEAFECYKKQSKIRNLSEYTIKYQINYFRKFKNFINDENFLIEDININIIDDYIYSMMENGNKTKSINTALNAFLHWCMDNDYCDRFKTGHADIMTTRKYINLYAKDVQNDYEKLNLLDRFLNNEKKAHINMKK